MERRTATLNDLDFLYNLHRVAMKTYVEEIWGWDEGWQKEYFRQKFDPAAIEIIRFDGKDVGAVVIEQRDTEVYISNIEILPEYQNRGIGMGIIREALAAAEQAEKPVALQVLKVNRARGLYERLGFSVVGETQTHYFMRSR